MRKYSLEVSRHAARILERMARREKELYRRAAAAFNSIEDDPSQGKALKGRLKELYSYRVGDYRIIYRILRQRLMVVVIDIGHRRQIYEDLL